MADGVEIDELSIASSIADSDAFLIQQSGTTRQIDFETMRKDAVDKGIVEKELVNSTQLQTAVAAVSDELDAVKAQIPAQASSSNQLADKDFVNSSIATNTSNFCGTFNSVAELEAYSGAKTNNDYAFVVTTDAAGNTKYNRYKYVEGTTPSWVFEYTLNNSSFTAEQWAAIQSGITAELVALLQNVTVQIAVGTIMMYPGSVAPAGCMFCRGEEVSRITYARLWNHAVEENLVGTLYGPGDGSTTFTLPDLRECVLVGAGQSSNDYDATTNPNGIHEHDVYSVGEFKDDQMQGHEHNMPLIDIRKNGAQTDYKNIYPDTTGSSTNGIVTDGTNGTPRVGTTTHGKQIGMNYVVKYL